MAQPMIKTAGGGFGDPNGIATGIDWSKADLESDEGRKQLAVAISSYYADLRAANDAKGYGGSDRYGLKYTRPGHISGLPERDEMDLRFYGPGDDTTIFQLFRYIDKRQSKNPTHKFASISASGIVFEQKRDGQEVRLRRVSAGSPTSLESTTWEGALGLDDEAKRFDDYGVFEQNIQTVPAIYRDKQATVLATLLTALGAGVNEAWATDLITTINNGCASILENAGTELGLPDNPEFTLVYNPRRASMVRQALISDLTLANDNSSKNQLEFNIRPVKTRKIDTANMYLTIPGYDMVLAEWDPLFAEYGRDHNRGMDAHIYRGRWNAGIGNTNQIRRITPA